MAFPGSIYAPPGPYTQTNFESPVQGLAASVRIPLLIGTGSEILTQSALEVVRGSSSTVDQKVVEEDETGRAVESISDTGEVTLTDFNGELSQLRVRNYPIVDGEGSGTTATTASAINVTVNGTPVVVLAVNGTTGVIQISVTPESTDEVKVTYYFNRTDTLITDTLSDQVSLDAPVIYGQVGESYEVSADVDDTLIFTVDSEDEVNVTVSESPSGGWTAAQVAAFINSAATGTSLVAGTAVNNFGDTVLSLTADRDVEVGNGTANTTLGLTNGDSTARNKVFYTFQSPVVDGSNGGITTTDTADVTVKVDGTQVIPTALDGNTGAVTLPFAPEVGAVVTCQYYFNSWQDTFDYLAHRNITEITQCGLTSDRNDYIDGADFVLKEDLILWGTAFLVEPGEHTTGFTYFNSSQVTGTLVDTRQYLAPCDAVVDSSVNPPVESRLEFELPLQPTTGNGLNDLIDTDTYTDVSNGRVDLPTNRPDLVLVYWGFSLSDALERGEVEVTKVASSTNTVTLAEPVPVGASVYATFYYNTIVDQEYAVAVESAGASGVGTYSVTNEEGVSLLTPQFGSKSSGLATVTLEFPSGSERTPDCRFETPFDTTLFNEPVEETVTVEFASLDATLGKYTVPGSGPYYVISGGSDHFDLEVDASTLTGGFVDLSDPLAGGGSGFSAQLVGNEVVYDADSGGTTFEIDSTNDTLDFEIDGVLIQAVANEGATQDLSDYVDAINQAAFGIYGATASAGAATSITIPAASFPSDTDDHYNDWSVVCTAGTGSGTTVYTVTDYVGSTGVLTLDGGSFDATSVFSLWNPAVAPYFTGATRFLAAVVITAGVYDELVLSYTGSVTGQTTISMTGANVIPAATYASASALATAMQTPMDAAITAAGLGCKITVGADTNGRLTFTLEADPTDTTGAFLEFVAGSSDAVDFALLAGLDTDTAQGGQAKLVHAPIARQYTDGVSPALYDRVVLRNRIIPGQGGSMDGQHNLDLCQLEILGGTGATQAGLTANETALAGIRGTVMEPTLSTLVGFGAGQVPAATYSTAADGQAVVTLYADGGTTPQNNVFKFTFEGTPVTVEFTDAAGSDIASGSSADVPLGPVSGVAQDTILSQIAAAMTAAGISAAPVQEGAGFRFRGTSSASSASIEIGSGNANDVLGFSEGDIVTRDDLEVETLVSALMAHSQLTVTLAILSWEGASGYFAEEALAKTVTDEANAKYLYVQSQGSAGAGTSSSVAFDEAATDSVTRPGTGLGVEDGDGGAGEDAVDGYFVISSDPVDGSGSSNTSLLNSGTGQDGLVGQTYRDEVTGLTFTLLEREGGGSYPTGETFTFTVSRVVTTDSNLPVNTVPGLEMIVSNTSGIEVADTAIVSTYDKGGNEPSVGDVYYISYDYTKQDYSPALYTKMSSISAAYGANNTENPVVLASYLAIVNGAVLVAIKQVQKDTDEDGDGVNDSASEQAYIDAIDEVEGALPGGSYPDVLTLLKSDSLTLFEYLARHCDIQSSIRYRAERTAICGLSAGTQPRDAGDTAQAVGRSRLRIVYPDIYTLSIDDAFGNTDTFLVDGSYMASAVSGNRVAPTIDVATPWTGAKIFGFDEIARVLDAVEQNQVAVRGVTVLDQQRQTIKIRQGLTTDMSNVLTKLPTVLTIADEVQRQTRAALDRFIGTKFLAGTTSQIEQQVSTTLKQLKAAQIIAAYTGVSANVAEDDPTTAEVEAYYQPVFPLLYIIVVFNLRASL